MRLAIADPVLMDVWRLVQLVQDRGQFLFTRILSLSILLIYCLPWSAYANPGSNIITINNTVERIHTAEQPVHHHPIKPPKNQDSASRGTQGALFLICGVILGVPLGVLAACGVREFVCAMYEKYRMEALRRNYLYRMKMPMTVPVR